MTLNKLNILLKHIHKEHKMVPDDENVRGVKYVRFSFDNRTTEIYSVTFDDVSLTTVNENRKRDLFKWANAYLDKKDDGFNFERDDPELFQTLEEMKNDVGE